MTVAKCSAPASWCRARTETCPCKHLHARWCRCNHGVDMSCKACQSRLGDRNQQATQVSAGCMHHALQQSCIRSYEPTHAHMRAGTPNMRPARCNQQRTRCTLPTLAAAHALKHAMKVSSQTAKSLPAANWGAERGMLSPLGATVTGACM